MKKGWSEVALGDVLAQDRQYVTELEPRSYKKLSVKLYGRGVVLDASVNGADVKMEKHQFAKAGQVIVSEIWAKKGAIGIVPADGSGALITSHFFIFDIVSNAVLPGWIHWILKANYLERQLSSNAFGTTGYAAVRPSAFLAAKIPLPPLVEQQRIVAHLDAIESRLNRAQKLREEQEVEIQASLRSVFHQFEANAEWLPMEAIAPLVRREVDVDAETSYPELGIRSFGRGTFHKPNVLGIETGKRLFEIHTGDLLFSNVFAWEGAIAVARPEDHGRFGSHRFMTCVCDRSQVMPEFLQFYFLTAAGLEKIKAASPGGAGRNRTLGIGKLAEIKVPIVPVVAQQEFKKLLDLRDRLRMEASQAKQYSAALLPSLIDQLFHS